MEKNIQEEINYRKEVMQRVINGEKPTMAEREWMHTHPVYNDCKGYPYLCSDILHFKEKTEYKVTVRVISNLSEMFSAPVIGVAYGNGAITILSGYLEDSHGKISKTNKTKFLGVAVSKPGDEDTVTFIADLGLMEVGFASLQIPKGSPRVRVLQKSSLPYHGLYMRKEIVSDNHVIYKCNKCDMEDCEEAFVFEIEWSEIIPD